MAIKAMSISVAMIFQKEGTLKTNQFSCNKYAFRLSANRPFRRKSKWPWDQAASFTIEKPAQDEKWRLYYPKNG
jgi:hypothetical protein